ncbi:Beta-ketoacyl synthase [Penicillium camemberti]|uniref:Beta-ketoacyl synthase n=1 Tax=Penicillium camemberti (strain FM 013) TaxID=1429867 RepID=A0A0G4NXW7_PENC3|nr:Beta-ketoacyl synthase [Penicillium camemberti]
MSLHGSFKDLDANNPPVQAVSYVRLGYGPPSVTWVPSLIPGKDGVGVAQTSLAELHVRGVPIDWHGYFKPFGGNRVALPTYAFHRERFWSEPPPPEIDANFNETCRALLGSGIRMAGTEMWMFTTSVAENEPAWLQECKVMDAVLMPGAAFFEFMCAAGNAVEVGQWDLTNVLLHAPLVFMPRARTRLQVTAPTLSLLLGISITTALAALRLDVTPDEVAAAEAEGGSLDVIRIDLAELPEGVMMAEVRIYVDYLLGAGAYLRSRSSRFR